MASVLSDYLAAAMRDARYETIEGGAWCGTIVSCPGVIALAESVGACEAELRSVLEEWVLLGLKLKHSLPVLQGIDLNREPEVEPVDAL